MVLGKYEMAIQINMLLDSVGRMFMFCSNFDMAGASIVGKLA